MSQNLHGSVTLRPSVESDSHFLHEVYTASRAEEMALSGWNAEQQRSFLEMQFKAQDDDYRRRFPEAAYDVVLDGDRRIGRCYVARSSQEIRILDLVLLPAERNRGIGTHLLQKLIAEAGTTRKPIRVYVEKRGQALGLFERLGFRDIEDTGMHFLMEWQPNPTSQ